MVAWLNRQLPLLIAIAVLVMLFQFVEQHAPSASAIAGWLKDLFWYLVAAGAFLWFLVLAVWLHDKDRLPNAFAKVLPMDVLDRLSNKKAIEEAATGLEKQALIINAESLAAALKAKVIGQDSVCTDVAQQIRRRLALSQRHKPVGVFLFAGPPGTGKTYLAKMLSRELDRKLLHFDMTQLAAGAFAGSQLFGMTKGYVGSDKYGQLTAGLRDFPDAIVLLDEIEKAHPEILKNFLTAWNDGFVTEASDGKHIDTSRAIFVLTSNAATDALARLASEYADDPEQLRSTSVNVLREHRFAPEVLSRIDRIFVFRPLAGLDIARVCALEMESMIEGYGLKVVGGGIAPEIIIELMARYKKIGAQASTRDLVRTLEEKIADSLIKAKQQGCDSIEITYEDGRVHARAVRRPNESSPA